MLLQTVNFLILILATIPQFAFGFGIHLIEVSDTDRSQIECTIAFLQKYFQYAEPLSGALISMSFTSASLNIQEGILNTIHAQAAVPWTVVVKNPHQPSTSSTSTTMILHEKPQCYFVITENLQDGDLEDVFEDWKTNINWNPLAQFVVYMSSIEETDEEMTELMIEILLNFMSRKIYNVNVIGRNEENGLFYGKTVFPYHPDNNCGNRVIAIETLDICDYYDAGTTKYNEDGDEEIGEEDNQFGDDENGDERNDEYENGDESDCEDVGVAGEEGEEVEEGGEEEGEEEVEDEGKEEKAGKEGNERGENKSEKDIERKEHEGRKGEESKNRDREVENEERESEEEEKENMGIVKVKEEENIRRNGYRFNDENTHRRQGEDENEYEGGYHKTTYQGEKAKEFLIDTNKTKAYEDENDEGHGLGDDVDEKLLKKVQRVNNLRSDKKFRANEKCCKEALQNVHKKGPSNRQKRQKRSQDKCKQSRHYKQYTSNDTSKQKIYLQEFYRALFLDKFPEDLSGCPVVAAYRPWEPYIFKEASDYSDSEHANPTTYESDEDTPADVEAHKLSSEESSEESSKESEGDGDGGGDNYSDADDADTDLNAYNDVDAFDVNDEPTMKLNGIEYQLMQTIGERLNIAIDLQVENSNLYHLFQQLIDGYIEMILGGIDEDPSISQFISSTIAYHQDDLTWCVAKAKRKYNLFNFLQSFHISTWIFTLCFILATSLNIFVAQKLLRIRLTHFGGFFVTILRILGIILSQSTNLSRLPNSLHITFGSAFFLAIMFINIYQSFLVSTLTTPKSSYQISHVEEIYRNRMTVTGSVESVRHLNKDGETFKYIRENFEICYNIEECLNRAATDERIAVAVSRQHAFYNPHIQRDQLYCFDRNENLYIYLVAMLLPRKYHLLHKINPIIQHVIESGHMEKWAREIDLKRKIHEDIQRAQKEPVQGLTINQVFGSFSLHGMLSVLAFLIFVLERWTHWMVVKKRTRLRLLKILHRKFSHK